MEIKIVRTNRDVPLQPRGLVSRARLSGTAHNVNGCFYGICWARLGSDKVAEAKIGLGLGLGLEPGNSSQARDRARASSSLAAV